MNQVCRRGAAFVLFAAAGVLSGCHTCHRDCEVTKICCPEEKLEPVVAEGWDVECEHVCIPPIRCPISKCSERPCAKVIAVRKLKPDELELRKKCVIEYKLKDPWCPAKEPDEADTKSEEADASSEMPPAPAPGQAHVEP